MKRLACLTLVLITLAGNLFVAFAESSSSQYQFNPLKEGELVYTGIRFSPECVPEPQKVEFTIYLRNVSANPLRIQLYNPALAKVGNEIEVEPSETTSVTSRYYVTQAECEKGSVAYCIQYKKPDGKGKTQFIRGSIKTSGTTVSPNTGSDETEKASQEEKGNIIVVKKPDEEEHDYSLATGFFVGGYNMVADEMLEGKYKDRLTIRPLRVSDFGEHKDVTMKEVDKTALAYKGSKNGEPIKIVLSFDENEELESVLLIYDRSSDSSADYGPQTLMTNIIGYTEAIISGFDSDLDYENLAEEMIIGLSNSEVGALDGHQYKIEGNGFSAEIDLAFGILGIFISR